MTDDYSVFDRYGEEIDALFPIDDLLTVDVSIIDITIRYSVTDAEENRWYSWWRDLMKADFGNACGENGIRWRGRRNDKIILLMMENQKISVIICCDQAGDALADILVMIRLKIVRC